MTGSAYAAIATKKNQLIRKALNGSLFFAPTTSTAVSALTDSTDGGLAPLPTGYKDGGLFTTDGVRMARAVTNSEITSGGQYQPTRADTTQDTLTVQIDFQETSKLTLSLFTGIAMSSLTMGTNGEVHIQKPQTPQPNLWRCLFLGVDVTPSGEIYVARNLPRCKVTNYADQAFVTNGDAAIQWGVTLEAQLDATLGFSQDDIFGGPGFLALKTDMGF